MNFYFLLEGRSTERRVYRAWVPRVFPHLSEVHRAAEVEHNHFFLFSANGQPAIFDAIDATIQDICARPVFNNLLICLDAEESGYTDKLREIRDVLDTSTARHNLHKHAPHLQIHPIVQHCCIETWFLGNMDMLPPESRTEPLRAWRQIYDVRTRDPEHLPALAGYRIRAQFHHDYLCAMVRDRSPKLSYSKNNPGHVCDASYLAALVRRHRETGHIASFGELVRVWESLGAAFPT